MQTSHGNFITTSVEQCIDDSPGVHPAYTFDTGIPSTSSSTDSEKSSVANSDCDDDTDGNDDECHGDDSMAKKPKTLKNRKRKRKSKFSASEMLAFLESYSAKREKADEEKLKLMTEESQEKKDSFFTQFLKILKNK